MTRPTVAALAKRRLRALGSTTMPAPEGCRPCRSGEHELCTVNYAVAGARTNNMRCRCDQLWHARPLTREQLELLAHRSLVEAVDADNRAVLDLAVPARLWATLQATPEEVATYTEAHRARAEQGHAERVARRAARQQVQP